MAEAPNAPMTREELARISGRVYALVRACPAGRATTYRWLVTINSQPR